MMRFMAFPETQLYPSMRDIGVTGNTGDCRWAEPTHRLAIKHTHTHRGIYLGVDRTEHTPLTPVPPEPSISVNLIYLSWPGLIGLPGKP
jgi:hypothetical protein